MPGDPGMRQAFAVISYSLSQFGDYLTGVRRRRAPDMQTNWAMASGENHLPGAVTLEGRFDRVASRKTTVPPLVGHTDAPDAAIRFSALVSLRSAKTRAFCAVRRAQSIPASLFTLCQWSGLPPSQKGRCIAQRSRPYHLPGVSGLECARFFSRPMSSDSQCF